MFLKELNIFPGLIWLLESTHCQVLGARGDVVLETWSALWYYGTVVSLGDCIDNFGQFAFFNLADCWLSSWGTVGSAKFLML